MRRLVLALVVAGAVMFQAASVARAGGSQVYPNGAEAFDCGLVPPPGVYYLNYNFMYTAHEFNDSDGDEIDAPGHPLTGFKMNVYANVSRFLWVTDKQFLGANWGMHAFIPIMDIDVKSKVFSDHDSGLGDIIVDPFILSWNRPKGAPPKYGVVCGLDIFLPTGDYKKHDVANVGKDLYVFEPVVGATVVLPAEVKLNAKFMYDIPSSNNDYITPMGTEVTLRPGQEFHVDFCVDKAIRPDLRLGLTGYFYRQVSSDEWDGKEVHGLGETLALGPGIWYQEAGICATLRSQWELYSENRPQGHALWAKLIYRF